MEEDIRTCAHWMAIFLLPSLMWIGGCRSNNTAESSPPPVAGTPAAPIPPAELQQRRNDAERRVNPDMEKERNNAEQQAQKSLDQDAIAAIQSTGKAIDAIAANNKQEALSQIEQATGKINILLARNPATALIPVDSEVDIIDTAPHDEATLKRFIAAATTAVEVRDFPTARVLLYGLMSEIRVRTTNLPLATYPDALKQSAALLDQGKNEEANTALLTALNTLVIIDRVTPLPLILARAAVSQAEAQSQKDKSAAQTLLETARNEMNRGKELGYAMDAPEYASLNNQISGLEKELKGGSEVSSLFARLRSDLTEFLNRQSQKEHR